ncbi:MAG TPA: transglutaminase-like domain-containing protein [Candidatus Krumholzibacteria bacterium]|nr:transglutaminase-like domain-containing protein [Candidatus Krumholzibacteria bacterium]HPD70758.1 transglutaminase-like domain-containing protein [Candidatus Krumholzibacteria bacterium]HRY39542.1 transglutaminase-like domain-containing protein [Candidatus Krumholzibacteria bacterium]
MRHRFARRLALPLLAACTFAIPAAGFAAGDAPGPGDDLGDRVRAAIAAHVEAGPLAAWHATLPDTSAERAAADWLLAWLPPSDLVTLDLVTLQEHVAFACAARRQAPWRDQLSDDLWLHYVVPHRVSQEPVQPWRGRLARELAPLVAGCGSMEEVALAVNRWCRQHATYTPTSSRDQGPLTTLAHGLGRCEEEMILTICALRAAGLPARPCSTPYWTFTDDNHAWVEVWADGRWHYAESCDDRACLDDAWFSGPASRAGFVRSQAYGEFTPAGEPLYRAADGATIVNSTAVYTRPFTLRATVAGAPDAPIHVNVLNYGTLRAIARLEPGACLDLGPGEYALTAASDGEMLLRVVRGEAGGAVTVELGRDDRYDLVASAPFWLRYPEPPAPPARALDLVSGAELARHRQLVAVRAAERRKVRELDAEEKALVDSLPAPLRSRWDAILAKPLDSPSVWVRMLSWADDPEQREALTAFLAAADDKDLLEWSERDVRAQVTAALSVRDAVHEAWGRAVPDSIWREGVLPGRIADEPGCDWRTALPVWRLAASADATLAAWIADFAARLEVAPDGPLGQPLAPHQTWRLRAARRTDLEVCFVGLCRRAGVPARWRLGRVEIWDGDWREVDPLAPDPQRPNEAGPAGRGWLHVSLTRGGLPVANAEPYRHFMVAEPGDGVLEHRWWDLHLGLQPLDAGDYVLGAVTRVPGGSACGRLRSFRVEPGDTTRVSLPLDVDTAGWDPAVLVETALIEPLERALAAGAGDGSVAGAGPTVMLLATPGEDLARLITALGRVWPRLANDQAMLQVRLAGPADPAPWAERLRDAGLPPTPPARAGDALDSFLAGPARRGPLVALRAGHGGWRLLRIGLDNELDSTIHLALDGMR